MPLTYENEGSDINIFHNGFWDDANALKSLVAKEILTFTENRIWYFGDKFNRFKQASKKNVMEMFGKMKPGLEKFLEDNHINYFDEPDIKKLAAFLQE